MSENTVSTSVCVGQKCVSKKCVFISVKLNCGSYLCTHYTK